ncbi:hypothetical protein L6452_04167 [Arctium lappa]|uniref:Uncharacterized protein n=1 Tax=Arctium lappa TaxID=4217 RepID=A0ACB9FPR1_ARCLA|nr:hypothetical protein L6452_04167 [Arctium lappa]
MLYLEFDHCQMCISIFQFFLIMGSIYANLRGLENSQWSYRILSKKDSQKKQNKKEKQRNKTISTPSFLFIFLHSPPHISLHIFSLSSSSSDFVSPITNSSQIPHLFALQFVNLCSLPPIQSNQEKS